MTKREAAEENAKERLVQAVKERDRRVAEAQQWLMAEVQAYNDLIRSLKELDEADSPA